MEGTHSPDAAASDPAAPATPPPRRYRFGDFFLDLTRGQLLRDGEPVIVSPKAFDLLRVLVENRNRVMSKDDLIAAVWRDA